MIWPTRCKLLHKYIHTRESRSSISRIFYKSDKFARSRLACYKSYTFSMHKSDFITRIFVKAGSFLLYVTSLKSDFDVTRAEKNLQNDTHYVSKLQYHLESGFK